MNFFIKDQGIDRGFVAEKYERNDAILSEMA
jgi:hypothetical protein